MPPPSNRSAVALGLWLLAVLGLTLAPGDEAAAGGGGALSGLCLACGARGVADLLLNTALFVPFGWMAAKRMGWRRTVLWGLALTLAIELGQGAIPGRYPTLGDVVANTAGTVVGAVLVRRTSLVPGILAGLALLGLVAPFPLLAPDPPPGVYYGQWTARFEDHAHYGGRVRTVRLGGVDVPSSRSDRSSELRRVLARDGPLDVSFEAGPPTPGLAPVFSIYDGARREIFLLGVDGTDLVIRRWLRARTARLASPGLRWEGALAGVGSGRPVRIRLERIDGRLCLRLDGRARCDLAPAQGSGWALLAGSEGRGRSPGEVAGVIFMMAAGLAIGLPFRKVWTTGVVVVACGAAGLALSAWLPYMTSSFPQASSLVLGGLVTAGVRDRRRGRRPHRSP